MADKLRLGSEVRELKIGQSFTNSKAGAFHTIRYDFKPASVDINKIATVDVGNNNQVTVTVPHLDGAGVPQTVFKGSQRPFQKECVLIIDKVTGEITLEKLSSNLQVKKTRSESTKPPLPQDRSSQGSSERSSLNSTRPQTPPIGQRQSNKTRVTSGSRRPERSITHLVPKHSPLHASPNPNYPSPGHHKSPKRDRDSHTTNESHSQSALASLPMIGVDDFSDPLPPPLPPASHHDSAPANSFRSIPENGVVGEMSDSSSSDSSSDSDSDRDSPTENKTAPVPSRSNGHSNGTQQQQQHHHHHQPQTQSVNSKMLMPTQLLNEDLCLSESGSDSD